MSNKLPTIGRLERVSFPTFDPIPGGVIAKIDTGADTGAIHCVFARIVKKKGKNWLEFQPLHEDRPVITTDKYSKVRVRSSNGITEGRYRIETTIMIRGESYPIELTPTDRSDMQYDVIIGHKFLNKRFLVDVSQENV